MLHELRVRRYLLFAEDRMVVPYILSVCKIRDQIVGFHNATRLTTLRDSAMPKISYMYKARRPPLLLRETEYRQ